MIVKFFVFLNCLALLIEGIGPIPDINQLPILILSNKQNVYESMENRFFAVYIDHAIEYQIITNTNKLHVLEECSANSAFCVERSFAKLKIHKVETNLAGNWKVISKMSDGSETIKEFTLIVQRNIEPAHENRSLSLLKGYLATIEFGEEISEVITKCNVTDPSGQKYEVPSASAKERGIELIENGVSVLVGDKSNGTWTVKVSPINYISYQMKVEIVVLHRSPTPKTGKVYLQRGYRDSINVSSELGINVCELIDSRNVSLPLSKGGCYYEINRVTNVHAGHWRARYCLVGKLEAVEYNFTVHVYDDKLLGTISLEKDETRGTILECRHKSNSSSSGVFCRFFRPDNVVFNVYHGIENNGYSSYIKNDEDGRTCGLIIREVSSKNYGLWRCEMVTTGQSNIHLGAFIEYKNPTEKNKLTVSARADDVIVKRGDSFKISCTANVSLDYCYFLTPDEKIMTVTNNLTSVTESNLLYNGIGLTAGRCGAEIPNAQNIHQGEWKCLMGTGDDLEVQAKFKLTVTESVLLISQEQIPTKANNTGTCLSLRLLPTVTDQGIQFCRWIKPNAISLDDAMDNRYTTSKTGSQCQLTISDPKAEDFGRWTWIVSLIGKQNEIISSYVNVTKGLSA